MPAVLQYDTNATGCNTFTQATDNTPRHKHIFHGRYRQGACSAPSPGAQVPHRPRSRQPIGRFAVADWQIRSQQPHWVQTPNGDDRIPTALTFLRSSATGEDGKLQPFLHCSARDRSLIALLSHPQLLTNQSQSYLPVISDLQS